MERSRENPSEIVDTIVAPITAAGVGPVAVVRISGPKTAEIGRRLLSSFAQIRSHPRELLLSPFVIPTELREADEGEQLDSVMAAYFRAPNSFTGEDVLEINLHGGSYILSRALELIVSSGARPARPGEFSERAFHSGKIDLTEAEAICDLINAETRGQHRIAEQQLSGKVSETILKVGEPLRDLLAEIEANIDFPEEEIDPLTYSDWAQVVTKIRDELEILISTFKGGKLLREGALVVLAGVPNAGKSSLLNRFLGENRAIVTAIPGTTRDSIEEVCSLNGLRVRLCDTAGLDAVATGVGIGRELDEVEKLGVERSWDLIARADVVLFVFDPTQDSALQQGLLSEVKNRSKTVKVVLNKSDLSRDVSGGVIVDATISAATGDGVRALGDLIAAELVGDATLQSSVIISSERHFNCLSRASGDLREALGVLSESQPAEIISFYIRAALNSLQEVVGVTENEEILGRIFSKFCIGK